LISYCFPLVVGYFADTKFGRYPMIFWGVIICGVGHVLIVAGGARELIEAGTAKIPFFIGVYILAIGAGMRATGPPFSLSKTFF
jgi:dipeptide/tripeptide permease